MDETVSGNEKSSSTGGAMIGFELNARMKINENTSFDITLGGAWVPTGSELAGEEDLSCIRIQGLNILNP